MAKNMKALDIASWLFCTIGALEVGIVGAFRYDVIGSLFGPTSMLTRIIYVLCGIGGVLSVAHMLKYMKKK